MTHPADHRNLTQNVYSESKLEGTNKLHVKFQFQCPSGGVCDDWGYVGTPYREHATSSQKPPDLKGAARRGHGFGHDLQGLKSPDLGRFSDVPLGTQALKVSEVALEWTTKQQSNASCWWGWGGDGGRPGIKICHFRDFPGGPVIKTPVLHCRKYGFNPGWGVKIPQASWPKKPKHKTSNILTNSIIFF